MTENHQETADGGRKSDGGNDDPKPGTVGVAYFMGISIGVFISVYFYLALTAFREIVMRVSQDRTLTGIAVGVFISVALLIAVTGLVYFVVRAWAERNSEGVAA